MYTEAQRKLQRQFDSERLADRIQERLVQTELDEDDKRLIESQVMFFLATADGQGRPNCSFKGGAPGFVQVLNPHTLVFPNYNGNGMYLSLGNAVENGHIGLLFIDFERQTRLRVNGEASIDPADPLLKVFPGAECLVRVHVLEAFPNCPRYIPKLKLDEMSAFIPKESEPAPIPEWKQSEWARDVLPADDPAR